MTKKNKLIIWVVLSHEDGKIFINDVQDVMGYALHLVECWESSANVKPLRLKMLFIKIDMEIEIEIILKKHIHTDTNVAGIQFFNIRI